VVTPPPGVAAMSMAIVERRVAAGGAGVLCAVHRGGQGHGMAHGEEKSPEVRTKSLLVLAVSRDTFRVIDYDVMWPRRPILAWSARCTTSMPGCVIFAFTRISREGPGCIQLHGAESRRKYQ